MNPPPRTCLYCHATYVLRMRAIHTSLSAVRTAQQCIEMRSTVFARSQTGCRLLGSKSFTEGLQWALKYLVVDLGSWAEGFDQFRWQKVHCVALVLLLFSFLIAISSTFFILSSKRSAKFSLFLIFRWPFIINCCPPPSQHNSLTSSWIFYLKFRVLLKGQDASNANNISSHTKRHFRPLREFFNFFC